MGAAGDAALDLGSGTALVLLGAEVLGRSCGAALGPGAGGGGALEPDAGSGLAGCWDRVLAASRRWFLISATDPYPSDGRADSNGTAVENQVGSDEACPNETLITNGSAARTLCIHIF